MEEIINKNKMLKTIFINVTAAEYGGALTILKSILTDISKNDITNLYYVFTSIDLDEFEKENIKIINTIKGKKSRKRLDRILWDSNGLQKWSVDNNIYADIILSLQNTGVKYNKKTRQIIYLHQPLPFETEYKWRPWKKEERIYWLYKNIYPYFIKRFMDENTILIVQQNWLKNKVIEKFDIDKKNVKVIPPKVSFPEVSQQHSDGNIKAHDIQDRDNIILFYPASPYVYKNHSIIIDSIIKIKNENPNLYSKLRVYFTVRLDELTMETSKKVSRNSLENIIFLGAIKPSEVVDYYNKSLVVIFPSYIETFGLPLLEAASFGKKIICSDTSFSREILRDYVGVTFVKYNDVKMWTNQICKLDTYIEKKYEYTYNALKDYDSVYELLKEYFSSAGDDLI
ncbi:MAG: glycosyltransferase [Clostridium sp.]|uniref:glycosyltransferase n=1 Tax=Clostridium sp. TaxID=1506 RepID=UPI003D6CC4DA